jgi:hypothetical protein
MNSERKNMYTIFILELNMMMNEIIYNQNLKNIIQECRKLMDGKILFKMK